MFEGLVEGVFSRAFSSEVQPVELARKLAKEMDAHKTASVSRVYVPNEYTVYLSKQDRGKLEGYERSQRREPAAGLVATRAIVSLDDRRYVLDGPKATIGRSKDTDCVLRDPNVSRRHAELRRAESGDWQIVDLGSTNGIKVNGRRVSSSRLRPGDQVTVGT